MIDKLDRCDFRCKPALTPDARTFPTPSLWIIQENPGSLLWLSSLTLSADTWSSPFALFEQFIIYVRSNLPGPVYEIPEHV